MICLLTVISIINTALIISVKNDIAILIGIVIGILEERE